VELLTIIHCLILFSSYRIGGAMVSKLATGVIDLGFEPWSRQTKDYEIGIFC
jgi:hypothetical protein